MQAPPARAVTQKQKARSCKGESAGHGEEEPPGHSVHEGRPKKEGQERQALRHGSGQERKPPAPRGPAKEALAGEGRPGEPEEEKPVDEPLGKAKGGPERKD